MGAGGPDARGTVQPCVPAHPGVGGPLPASREEEGGGGSGLTGTGV